MSSATVTTWASILNFPIFDAEITTPFNRRNRTYPGNSKLTSDDDHDCPRGASWFSTSEISRREISSLFGNRIEKLTETCDLPTTARDVAVENSQSRAAPKNITTPSKCLGTPSQFLRKRASAAPTTSRAR
jgi:hypothetical protein